MAGRKLRAPVAVHSVGPTGFAPVEPWEQSCDFLFGHWPGNDSLAWTDAMTCRAVDDASTAFLFALEEAGIDHSRTVEIY